MRNRITLLLLQVCSDFDAVDILTSDTVLDLGVAVAIATSVGLLD